MRKKHFKILGYWFFLGAFLSLVFAGMNNLPIICSWVPLSLAWVGAGLAMAGTM